MYRVCEIHLSLAGHFVRRTASPSPNILTSCWTFHCKMSSDIKKLLLNILNSSPDIYLSLIYSPRTFWPARSNPFAGHFSKFLGHVRRISRTLGLYTVLIPELKLISYTDCLKSSLLVAASKVNVWSMNFNACKI